MATRAADAEWQPHASDGEGVRYTRVAIWLHWAIAGLIIYNLISGLLVWDLARDFFKEHRAFYGFGITSHLSSGMTVLLLTVIRIGWRLMHEPPPYPATMKSWERHAAHIAHFFLYAGMLLMPLTGWAILSAHPPAGSAGAKIAPIPMAASPMARPPGAAPSAPPPAAKGPPGIWWVIPLPTITPITDIGREPGGVAPQHKLHEQFADWHEIGAYLMILLLVLHIGGALKHQIVDKEPELQRMGVRRRKPKA
jgi:cytochrome b561